MKLYTIQPEFKLNELNNTGILKSGDNIMDDYFLDSYAWLENKMHFWLPKPEVECLHPVWAWYRYRGKRKPDLRYSGYSNKGDTLFRIEFDIEDDKVLLSDFSDWHLILNANDEDKKLEHCILPLDWHSKEDIEEAVKEGWIVSNDKLIYNWNNIILDANSNKKDIQATVWYIKQEQIKDIVKFNSK